jgi:hypothetical protein
MICFVVASGCFGINPSLMTLKPCGLAQRVRFSGLSWHEAGIYPAEIVARELLAIMITRLQKINPPLAHEIDDAMLMGQPPRPVAWRDILKRFGFANSIKWIAQVGVNQFKCAQN